MKSENLPPTLETSRVIMRPVQMSDASLYQSLFANYEVIEFLDGNVIPWPYPENGVVEFLNFVLPRMEAGETIVWALVQKGTDEMIGVLHLNPHSETDHRGFWLDMRIVVLTFFKVLARSGAERAVGAEPLGEFKGSSRN